MEAKFDMEKWREKQIAEGKWKGDPKSFDSKYAKTDVGPSKGFTKAPVAR